MNNRHNSNNNKHSANKPGNVPVKENNHERDTADCNKEISHPIGDCFNTGSHKDVSERKRNDPQQAFTSDDKLFFGIAATLFVCFFVSAFLIRYHCFLYGGIMTIPLLIAVFYEIKSAILSTAFIEAQVTISIFLIMWLVIAFMRFPDNIIFVYK